MNQTIFLETKSITTFRALIALSAVLLILAACSGATSEDPLVEETQNAPAETEATLAAPDPAVPRVPEVAVVEQTTPATIATPTAPHPELEEAVPTTSITANPPVESGRNLASSIVDSVPVDPEPVRPTTILVPQGSPIRVLLVDAISSSRNRAGDQFLASLVEPIVVGDQIVVDEGVTLRGRVVEVQESGRVQGRASVELVLTHIIANGDPIAISTRPFVEQAESDLGRDATLGGIGAAVGGAIGALTGGGKGAAIGAVAGGAGTVAATRGRDLQYPAETRLDFALNQAVELPRIQGPSRTSGNLGF